MKTGYTLSGDTTGTYPGTYTATAALEKGYKWDNNSTDPKTQQWKIDKRNAQYTDFSVIPTSAVYTGKAQTPTVALNSTLAQNGGYGDLTVEYRNVKNYTYLTAD